MRSARPVAYSLPLTASIAMRVKLGPVSLLLLLGLVFPPIALAVVCPFTVNMPVGKYPVGHSAQWVEAVAPAQGRMLQWWYPADPVKDSAAASHVYGDYLGERMRTRRPPPEDFDPELHARQMAIAKAAKARNAPAVLYDHMMASGMLAARESTPRLEDWPVLWLDGDPSFGDQLASHGFIVVSSPPPYGTSPTQEARVEAARDAIELTRTKFQSKLRRIGFIGFGEGALLAARLNGLYPQASGLVLIGSWNALDPNYGRKETRWLNPSEIKGPTLQIVSGMHALEALQTHPLQAPFSATTRLHFGDVDDAHLEFGIPESCVPNYLEARRVSSLVLVVSQYELRLRLAQFFAEVFDVAIEPAPLKMLPLAERRRQPLQLREELVPAQHPAPPATQAIAALLSKGGVDELLRALPATSQALLPASWWDNAIAQLYVAGDPAQLPKLVNAWKNQQPGSLEAAVRFATLQEENGKDAKKLWKEARRLVKSDQRTAPERRAELARVIDAAIKR
jgi:hypothetical protein